MIGTNERPSNHLSDHSIKKMTSIDTTSRQVMSETGFEIPGHLQSTLTVTPTIPLQTSASYTPKNLVGTPSHKIIQNPSIQQNLIAGQIPTGGQPSFNGKISTRGKPSFSGQISIGGKPSFSGKNMTGGKPPFIGQIPFATQSMTERPFQPPFNGNLQQSWGPPQGGIFHQPHQGGSSNPNPRGGTFNPNPSGLYSRQPFLGVSNPT